MVNISKTATIIAGTSIGAGFGLVLGGPLGLVVLGLIAYYLSKVASTD